MNVVNTRDSSNRRRIPTETMVWNYCQSRNLNEGDE